MESVPYSEEMTYPMYNLTGIDMLLIGSEISKEAEQNVPMDEIYPMKDFPYSDPVDVAIKWLEQERDMLERDAELIRKWHIPKEKLVPEDFFTRPLANCRIYEYEINERKRVKELNARIRLRIKLDKEKGVFRKWKTVGTGSKKGVKRKKNVGMIRKNVGVVKKNAYKFVKNVSCKFEKNELVKVRQTRQVTRSSTVTRAPDVEITHVTPSPLQIDAGDNVYGNMATSVPTPTHVPVTGVKRKAEPVHEESTTSKRRRTPNSKYASNIYDLSTSAATTPGCVRRVAKPRKKTTHLGR